MSPKRSYKALLFFEGHKPGQQFEANLDPTVEQRAIDSGHIEKVETKQGKEKSDG